MRANRLPVGLCNRTKASAIAFKIVHAIQDEPLEYAAAALGLCLKAVEIEKKLSPTEIMTAASNMLAAHGLEDDNYVTALRSFVKEEIQ